MRPIGAEHVNRGGRHIVSLLASFAVAITFFRFGADHFQRERAESAAAKQ